MLSHVGSLLTFSALRSAVVSVLLLLVVAWTAGCEREGAVDPTAAAPTTATAEAEPGAAEEPRSADSLSGHADADQRARGRPVPIAYQHGYRYAGSAAHGSSRPRPSRVRGSPLRADMGHR